jgi:chemosensory pili system protein ChpB (putative protein-glutamate methylesterase)
MVDSAPRVVVLGRPGEAQQQLQKALDELGAQTLSVGDFDQLDPAQMREQQPDVWLVSMDESTDSAVLERWQPLFDDPDATVVFDDADVTSRLSGWDLARWARHLAAKVLGQDNVLPPVHPDAERLPAAPAANAFSGLELEPLDSGSGDSAGEPSSADGSADDAAFAALSASFESVRRQQKADAEARPAAMALDDLLREGADTDAGRETKATVDASSSTAAAAAPSSSLPGLSLIDLDVDLSAPRVARAPETEIGIDVSHLELAPIEQSESIEKSEKKAAPAGGSNGGLIAIIAGLGGPDAVRQFLGALPAGLPVPVLLWQHLDAGKHDRLAQQLSKATRLPVYLAKSGELAKTGAIGVVGSGLGILGDSGWWFEQGSPSPTHGLSPALDNAATVIVILSGAEPSIVERARAHAASGGGMVLVQTPSSCFDGTAVSALDGAQGVETGAPAELAKLAIDYVSK